MARHLGEQGGWVEGGAVRGLKGEGAGGSLEGVRGLQDHHTRIFDPQP